MAAVIASNIADLVTTTLQNVEKAKFTDIVTTLQRLVCMGRLLKKNKTVFDSGVDFRFDLMTNHNNSAGAAGLYYQLNINVPDVMTQGIIPWRHTKYHWAIERREIAMNRSPSKIVDIALVRRTSALASFALYLEDMFWGLTPSTDTITPYGYANWIVKNATEGFNGGNPSGYTSGIGSISTTTFPNFQNWTAQYTNATREDLMRKWYKAAEYTDFDTVVPNMPTFNTGDDMAYYTNWGLLGPLREILRGNNDDLGGDLAAFESGTTFMQKPVERVPQLDADTTNPLIGINWGEMAIAGLRGEWMHETSIPMMPNQPTVAAHVVDLTMQPFTRNRRRHFILATGTTLP